jgi:flagellar capping protein FliD
MILEWILFIVIAHFIFTIFSGRTLKQNEYLLNKIIRRLEEMPSKADLDNAIAALTQAISDEATKLQSAIDALQAQINAGGDFTAEVQALQDAQTRIAALPTTATPPTP